ncbi:hypothetical protein EEDFHM_03581 [Methylorubrum populi]
MISASDDDRMDEVRKRMFTGVHQAWDWCKFLFGAKENVPDKTYYLVYIK